MPQDDEKKLCPFRGIAEGGPDGNRFPPYCFDERCALWNEDWKRCSMSVVGAEISRAAYEIAQIGRA
jgi:hypothetical protein